MRETKYLESKYDMNTMKPCIIKSRHGSVNMLMIFDDSTVSQKVVKRCMKSVYYM